MNLPTEFECDKCKEVKKICCAYWGKDGYCYCKDCCPYKEQHVKDREEISGQTKQKEIPTMSQDLEYEIKKLIHDELVSYGLIEGSAEDE